MIELLLLFISAYAEIESTPTICTIPPDDPLISEQIKRNYLRETKNGILEWQYMIQSVAKKPANWAMNYQEGYKPNCDIVIEFKRYYEDVEMPDYYDVLGSYYEGKIELYFQEFSTCGEHGETRCYYEDVITSRELGVTARHEFGHALGLGHESEYDTFGNAGSIMNEYSNRISDQNQITTYDINNVISLYGQDGFNQYKGKIAPWVRNNAEWYSEDIISEKEFADAVRHLINIEQVKTRPNLLHGEDIPDWFKNTAGWWADGRITDYDFLKGIEYMVNKGIIKV